jgi:hypothetical protein
MSQKELSPDPLPDNLVSPITPSKKIKIIIHIGSMLLTGVLVTLFVVLVSGPSVTLSLPKLLLATLVYGIIFFPYYLLAGGMEWKEEKLPTIRIVLFWVLSGIIFGVVCYGIWYLVRYILAKIYAIPLPIVMGRLLATRQKIYWAPVIETESGKSCENCGTHTSAGKYYQFVCGDTISTSTTYEPGGASINKITTTKYRISESAPVYLCNKCVILKNYRDIANWFKKALIVALVMLVIFIPLSIAMDNQIFMLPALFLFFGGIVAFFQRRSLQVKEEPPQQAYSNIYSNPFIGTKTKQQFYSNIDKDILNQGEKFAIRLKKASLKSVGIDAFFTHEEAKKLR